MIKVKVVRDLYSENYDECKSINHLIGKTFNVNKIDTGFLNGVQRKFVTIDDANIWEGEFEIIEGPVEQPTKNNTADSNSISNIELMEISDICISGTFKFKGVLYGFCFTPTENQKHWDFYPRLRVNQKEVKEALTARIFRDVMV